MRSNVFTWAGMPTEGPSLDRVVSIDVFTTCDVCGRPFQPLQLQHVESHHGVMCVVHRGRCRERILEVVLIRLGLQSQEIQDE